MISQLISLSLSSFDLTFVWWFISSLCLILWIILVSYFFFLLIYFRSDFHLFFQVHVSFTASILFWFFNSWEVVNTIIVVLIDIIFYFRSIIVFLGKLFLLIRFTDNISCIFKSNCSFSIWKRSILFSIFRLWWRILLLTDFFDHLCLDFRMVCYIIAFS